MTSKNEEEEEGEGEPPWAGHRSRLLPPLKADNILFFTLFFKLKKKFNKHIMYY